MCEIAAEIAGCEMFTCFEASVMLPVSPAAMKYDSWRNVNFSGFYHSLKEYSSVNPTVRGCVTIACERLPKIPGSA